MYREEGESRAFPGWRAEEIHRALTEAPMSEVALRALERTALAMGARQGTKPEDDPLMRSISHRAQARGRLEMLASNVHTVLYARGIEVTSELAELRELLKHPNSRVTQSLTRKVEVVHPSYQPSKAEFEADSRVDATFDIDDESYMYFGWWQRENRSTDALTFSAFSGGMHPATGNDFNGLEGSATYSGPAIGHYAVQQELGNVSSSDSLTATVELDAQFGSDTAGGMISGEIDDVSNDDRQQ